MNITTKYDLGRVVPVTVDEFNAQHRLTGKQKTLPGVIDCIRIDSGGAWYRIAHEDGQEWKREGEIT